jgi:predicted nucleotidyltransferase component of viral defense system
MNLFDQLVSLATKRQSGLIPLRSVVEKELLHHDILREMNKAGLLAQLTFIGGTCLRMCYNSNRLSEDLDFTGGHAFNKAALSVMGQALPDMFRAKYGLEAQVKEPTRETGNVNTWRLKILTQPEEKHLPIQKINLDVCSIPSHDQRPMMLRNHYGVDMGTSGLIFRAQSREEILADKVVAMAFRPNRIKNRDLWDIGWLKQQNVELPMKLVPLKIADHRRTPDEFICLLSARLKPLPGDKAAHADFVGEMRRFLPASVVKETVEKPDFWQYLTRLIREECDQVFATMK